MLAGSSSVGCELKLSGDKWFVSGDPYVLYRAEKAIPFCKVEKEGARTWPATEEIAVELLWFMQRFKNIHSKYELVLRSAAAKFNLGRIAADKVMRGEYDPGLIKFRDGEAPRDYQAQNAMLWRSVGGLLCADGLGTGKAQPLDCKVLTPRGWKTIGELKPGDAVCDPDGGYGIVTGVYDQGVREVYEVKTRDGRSTRCCKEHLWTVITGKDRDQGTTTTMRLWDFMDDLARQYGKDRQWIYRIFLPLSQPRPGTTKWKVDPWLIGFLIGDGSLRVNSVSVSCYDEELRERIRSVLPDGVQMRQVKAGSLLVHDYRLSVKNSGVNINPLVDDMRELGLLGKRAWEKRLPESAFHLSPDDKLEVLRGLMDADGTIGTQAKAGGSKRSTVTFTTTSEGLADDTRELVELLGGFATKTSRITKYTYKGERREGRRSYTLIIRLPVCPFSLKRKADRWYKPYMARPITSVVSVGMAETRCIRVNTKRNLYVTDGHLVTHNTISGLAGIAGQDMLPALIVAPSALCLQWKQQIEWFLPGLSSHIIKQQRNYDLQVVATCEQCGEAATAQSVATRRCKYCKGTRFKRSHADIYLLSYNLADHWKIEISRVVKSVIYEEAHELRLDASAKYKACKYIANHARFRLGLTGSPVMNWGGEMYNIINLLCPGKLGTKSQFQETWCGASEGAGKEPPLKEPEAFAQYLKNQHMMTRRTREDVGRYIPEEQQIIHNIDFDEAVFSKMTKDAKELARAIVRMSEGELPKPDNLAASRFNQMLYQATGEAKAPFVASFAEMILESGEPIMLFGHHRNCFEIYCRMLGRYSPLLFTGSENRNQKEHNKQQFMAGKSNLIICSLMSGVGIDGLQNRCNIGVFGELAWSPGVLRQCIGRYHRDGQKNPCLTYILTSEVGIDPYMMTTLGVKRLQVDGVVQAKATSNVMDSVDTMVHLRELAKKFLAA